MQQMWQPEKRTGSRSQAPRWAARGHRVLFKPAFVQKVQAYEAVLLAKGNRGPPRGDRPLDSDHLGVTGGDVGDVSECDGRGDLLLESEASLGGAFDAGEGRVDTELADTEEALQTAGYGAGDRRAKQGRGAHLRPGLRGRLLIPERGIGRRCVAGGEEGHDLRELEGRVGARGQGEFVEGAGDGQSDIDTPCSGVEIDIQNRLDLYGIVERN